MSKEEQKSDGDQFLLKKLFPDPLQTILEPSIKPSVLAQECLFLLDTNVLLAPYRVGVESVKDVESIYVALVKHGRIYVPMRALREFVKNRHTALSDSFSHIHNRLSTIPSVAGIQLPMLEETEIFAALHKAITDLKSASKEYKEALTKAKDELLDWSWNDPVSALYRKVFSKNNVIDHALSDDDLLKDVKWRFDQKVAPGYKDKGKDDGGIGDVEIWHSALALGEREKKHLFFVSNEEKADWVVRLHEETLAPKPELQTEYFARSGHHFSLISFTQFLRMTNAKEKTVDDFAAHDEAFVRLAPLEYKLQVIIERLASMCLMYAYNEDDEAEHRVLGAGFNRLVDAFRSAKTAFLLIEPSATTTKYLGEFEKFLSRMSSLNHHIEYQSVRMKYSTDDEERELHTLCIEFDALASLWQDWRKSKQAESSQ